MPPQVLAFHAFPLEAVGGGEREHGAAVVPDAPSLQAPLAPGAETPWAPGEEWAVRRKVCSRSSLGTLLVRKRASAISRSPGVRQGIAQLATHRGHGVALQTHVSGKSPPMDAFRMHNSTTLLYIRSNYTMAYGHA